MYGTGDADPVTAGRGPGRSRAEHAPAPRGRVQVLSLRGPADANHRGHPPLTVSFWVESSIGTTHSTAPVSNRNLTGVSPTKPSTHTSIASASTGSLASTSLTVAMIEGCSVGQTRRTSDLHP